MKKVKLVLLVMAVIYLVPFMITVADARIAQVAVVNDELSPVPVTVIDRLSNSIVSANASVTGIEYANNNKSKLLYTVPEGKKFILTDVLASPLSIEYTRWASFDISGELKLGIAGSSGDLLMTAKSWTIKSGIPFEAGSQLLLNVTELRGSYGYPYGLSVTISGYLIDAE